MNDKERPFSCKICTFMFKRKEHLRRHFKTHKLPIHTINEYLKLYDYI